MEIFTQVCRKAWYHYAADHVPRRFGMSLTTTHPHAFSHLENDISRDIRIVGVRLWDDSLSMTLSTSQHKQPLPATGPPFLTFINHHQPSLVMVNLIKPSSTIIKHHWGIINSHQPALTNVNHHEPTINQRKASTITSPWIPRIDSSPRVAPVPNRRSVPGAAHLGGDRWFMVNQWESLVEVWLVLD